MASQAFSQFIITDGTTVIDLLELNKYGFGIGIEEYHPGRPQLKGGGVWQDSPFANGRQLAYSVKDNVNDAVTLQFSYRSHNEIIQAQETLDLMIEKALAYWGTDWQDDPIYIKAQALGETAARYALIYNMGFDAYHDPFHEPYSLNGPAPYMADGIILGIERSVWLENAPGTGTAITLFHEDHTDETTTGVTISNYRNAGLTHIYTHSGSFSGNLLSASLPYDLFSATIAVGSLVYFGSPTPFFGLSFDLSVAMSASAWTITWEYLATGSVWTEIDHVTTVADDFSVTGVNNIVFGIINDADYQPDMNLAGGLDWITGSINGTTQYWVRARVSALTGAATAPTQQTRHPYSITTPYAKVDSDQIDGTLDALVKLILIRPFYSSNSSASDGSTGIHSTIMAGLRSVDRGSNFTAYLNLKAADNPTGISISTRSGTAYADNYKTPAGYFLRWTAGASETLEERVTFDFTSVIARDFYGRFRVFARINYTDTTGASTMRVRLETGVSLGLGITQFTGRTLALPASPAIYNFFLADLGYIQIPSSNLLKPTEAISSFSICLDAYTINTKVIEFIDVFLLPTDEWAATVTIDPSDISSLDERLEIDSISNPKFPIRSLGFTPGTSSVNNVRGTSSNNEAVMHVNTTQAVWIIRKWNEAAYLCFTDEIRCERQQRYHNLRSA